MVLKEGSYRERSRGGGGGCEDPCGGGGGCMQRFIASNNAKRRVSFLFPIERKDKKGTMMKNQNKMEMKNIMEVLLDVFVDYLPLVAS